MEIPNELCGEVKLAIAETGTLGTIGAFSTVADIATISGWWGYLLWKFSEYYGYQMTKDFAKNICAGILTGMGGYYVGCKTATKFFHLIPGAGTVTACACSSVANILFTYRFAVTLARIFKRGNVNFDGLKDVVMTMFAGTGGMLQNGKDIVDLYLHY